MDPIPVRGQVVPDFSLEDVSGRTVRRSDYRGRLHVIVLFVPSLEDDAARAYVRGLVGNRATIAAAAGTVLVVVRTPPEDDPAEDEELRAFPVLVDAEGRAASRFLPGGARAGVFVTDRYGELYFARVTKATTELPPIDEILSWLEAVDNQCAI